MLGPLLVFGFVALYGAIIFLVFRWSRTVIGRRAQAAADALAAAGAKIVAVHSAPGIWHPASVELTLDGRPATFLVRRWSRDYLLCSIAVPSAPLPHVLVRRERVSDRLGKRMGFNREVQLGDAAFDEAAFIDTAESEDLVRRLLERPDVRAAVLAVLATGYSVDMSAAGLRATRVQPKLRDIDPVAVPAAVAALEALAPLLPVLPRAELGTPHWNRSPRALFAAMGIALVGYMVLGLAGAVTHPLASRGDIPYMFVGGGVIWLAAVVGLFFFLRGGTQSLRLFLIASFLLVISVPAAGAVLTAVANSAFDGSPAVTHSTRVLTLPRHPKKDNQVTVASWRPDRDQLFVAVPRSRLKDLKVGDALDVTTHAGAFGWEWIEAVK
jgi:hypothetical protein